MGGRCKVLVDGVFLSDAVCLEVGGGGQSVFFVFKDESTDVFGEQLDNYRWGRRVLLGRDGERVGDGGVKGRGSVTGKIATLFGGGEDGKYNLLVDNVENFSRGGSCWRQAVHGCAGSLHVEIGPGGSPSRITARR